MKEKEILNPQDADLEEAVIGACMVESEAIALVADKLRPEMFYTEVNGMIFAAVQSMFHAGKKIDILTVKSELAARGALEKVGGPYNLDCFAHSFGDTCGISCMYTSGTVYPQGDDYRFAQAVGCRCR